MELVALAEAYGLPVGSFFDELNAEAEDVNHRIAPEFKDDPAKSNEGKLEAIQMAWHEEFSDQ